MPETFSFRSFLLLPTPFLHVAIESITDEELISLARKAVSAALAGVNEMRRREGENLAADLNKRIDLLREKLLYLKSKQNIIVEDYEKKASQPHDQIIGRQWECLG